jgi:hypothetical protein
MNSITNLPVKISKNASHSDITILNNRIIIVWDEISKDGTGIFTAQSMDKGATWSMPLRLSVNGTNATHPRIVASDHNALILWTEKQSKQASQWAMTWLD